MEKDYLDKTRKILLFSTQRRKMVPGRELRGNQRIQITAGIQISDLSRFCRFQEASYKRSPEGFRGHYFGILWEWNEERVFHEQNKWGRTHFRRESRQKWEQVREKRDREHSENFILIEVPGDYDGEAEWNFGISLKNKVCLSFSFEIIFLRTWVYSTNKISVSESWNSLLRIKRVSVAYSWKILNLSFNAAHLLYFTS